MKKGIHPENYRLVAFKDMSNDDVFITKSTANTNAKFYLHILGSVHIQGFSSDRAVLEPSGS